QKTRYAQTVLPVHKNAPTDYIYTRLYLKNKKLYFDYLKY
ncbi:hypothetical protein HMPREF1552_01998, partial [Leptotrichia sp. oral taxon 879 str. F0557]